MDKYEVLEAFERQKKRLEDEHQVRLEFTYHKHGPLELKPNIGVIVTDKTLVGVELILVIGEQFDPVTGNAIFDFHKVKAALLRLSGPSFWVDALTAIQARLAQLNLDAMQRVITAAKQLRVTSVVSPPLTAVVLNNVVLTVSEAQSEELRTLPEGALHSALSQLVTLLLPHWTRERQALAGNVEPTQIGLYLMSKAISDIETYNFKQGMNRQRDEQQGFRW